MNLNWFIVFMLFAELESKKLNSGTCESSHLNEDSENVHVLCHGIFAEAENLTQNMKNITEPISLFELHSATLDALPSDMFQYVKNTALQKIIFDNVSLQLLSVPHLEAVPFKSVEDTLESFEVYNSQSVFAWDFRILSSLKGMKNIIIENSDYISVIIPFTFWPKLRFVQLINSSIQWLHPRAFRANPKLTFCSLSNNRISAIQRTMFPQPASRLWSLDLSFNRLEYLPEDMFEDMDKLHELKLDNNRLKKISEDLLSPVWRKLTHFWLDGNNIRCNSVCWARDSIKDILFLDSTKCERHGKFILLDSHENNCT